MKCSKLINFGQTCAKAALVYKWDFVVSKFHDNYFELCVVVSKFFSP